MKRSYIVTGLILFIIIIDQWLKIWVKTHMAYREEFLILGLEWARIHFVENNGMAFGLSIGGNYGKLILSLFRIVAVVFLIYYIRRLLEEKVSLGLLCSFGLILAGAIGNIIDSVFYGMIFSSSYHGGVASMFPPGGGYAGILYGKVVDMFYFPMFKGTFPSWIPFFGGEPYLFFRPVFNIADVSITTGVLSIIIFYRSFFSSQSNTPEEALSDTDNADIITNS